MARSTVYNSIVTDELYEKINQDNKDLLDEFVEYLQSIDRSPGTINNYISDIKICFIWNLKYNKNKFFVNFTKRDIMKYQNYLINGLKLSSNRIRRLKASISSLSNFIETVLDDIYPNFRNIINKIPAPMKQEVRSKTILTEEQIRYLLNHLIKNYQYQKACVLALAVASGSRKTELLRFKVYYFDDKNIKYGSLYKTPEKIKTKGRSSKGKLIYRYVLVNKFKPYLDLWLKQRKELGINCEELFVFKRNGQWQPMKVSTLDSWAMQFSKILNVDFYWHSLRHYFTTYLSICGIPADIIKEIIGWESTEMVSLYNDTEIDEELSKYFNANGIKKIKKKELEDL